MVVGRKARAGPYPCKYATSDLNEGNGARQAYVKLGCESCSGYDALASKTRKRCDLKWTLCFLEQTVSKKGLCASTVCTRSSGCKVVHTCNSDWLPWVCCCTPLPAQVLQAVFDATASAPTQISLRDVMLVACIAPPPTMAKFSRKESDLDCKREHCPANAAIWCVRGEVPSQRYLTELISPATHPTCGSHIIYAPS